MSNKVKIRFPVLQLQICFILSFASETPPPPEMSPPVSPPSPEMEQSAAAVEKILNSSFNNEKLLKEALTHSCDVASIYIDDRLVASESSKQKEIAWLNVAKLALEKLGRDEPFKIVNVELAGIDDESFEIENAKQKLKELSGKRRWLKPVYSNEKVLGPSHDRKYVCSVQILTPEGTLFMMGDEKTTLKVADNSAAFLDDSCITGTQFLSRGNMEGGYFSDNSNMS